MPEKELRIVVRAEISFPDGGSTTYSKMVHSFAEAEKLLQDYKIEIQNEHA